MRVSPEVVAFLEEHQELVDENRYEELFSIFFASKNVRGELGAVLEAAGLRPLLYMKDVPVFYLFEQPSITTLSIPNSIQAIHYCAFYGCSNLQNVQIGKNVETIDTEAFARCTSLRSVKFPATLTYISSAAFQSCTSLKEVEFESCPRGLGPGVFRNTSIEKVVLKDSLRNWEVCLDNSASNKILREVPVHCTDGVYKWEDTKWKLQD